MKRVTTATSHHSGWLSLFCISLLLSSFVALPMIEDLTQSQQAESGQSRRWCKRTPHVRFPDSPAIVTNLLKNWVFLGVPL